MKYKLKSSVEDVANNIKKSKWVFNEDYKEKAKYIVNFCPKNLLKNVDEIVNNEPISEIEIVIKKDERVIKTSLNKMYKQFYEKVPYIILIYVISLDFNGESGFLYLHEMFQFVV